jgi:ankyrin repeat protein
MEQSERPGETTFFLASIVAKNIHSVAGRLAHQSFRSKTDTELLNDIKEVASELEQSFSIATSREWAQEDISQFQAIVSVLVAGTKTMQKAISSNDLKSVLHQLRTQCGVFRVMLSANPYPSSTLSPQYDLSVQQMVSDPIGSHATSLTNTPKPLLRGRGLECVFEPRTADTDVIFVHGLDGHSRRTWAGTTAFWPQDFIPYEIEFSSCRVLMFGYDTDTIQDDNEVRLEDLANALLVDLCKSRTAFGNRRIIFVAHSFGGIVVKAALVKSLQAEPNSPDASISTSTGGIIFLGTPHKFSSTLARSATFKSMSAAFKSLGPGEPRPGLSRTSSREAPTISENGLDDNTTFTKLVNDNGIMLYSFYEKRPTLRGRGPLKVTDSFMQLNHPQEAVKFLAGNHDSMCRFENQEDDGYLEIKRAIRDILYKNSIPRHTTKLSMFNVPLKRERSVSSIRSSNLAPRTVDGPAAYSDFRRELESPLAMWASANPETKWLGKWLTDSDTLEGWLGDDAKQILYITGPTGCGKSAVAQSVFEYLAGRKKAHRRNRDTCFLHMFFKLEEITQYDRRTVLQALLAQLLDQNPELLKHVTRRGVGQRPMDDISDGKLLAVLRSMLEDSCYARVFCVVDTIDECNEHAMGPVLKLLKLLLTMPHVKAIITSKEAQHLKQALGNRPESYTSIDVLEHPDWQQAARGNIDVRIQEAKSRLPKPRDDSMKAAVGALFDSLRAKLLYDEQLSFVAVNITIQECQRSCLLAETSQDVAALTAKVKNARDLAVNLDSLYVELLKSITKEHTLLERSVSFLACCFKSLRLSDLDMILGVSEHHPTDLQDAVLHGTANLAEIINEELGSLVSLHGDMVQLCDEDFQRFVLSQLRRDWGSVFPLSHFQLEADVHLEMARACLHLLCVCYQSNIAKTAEGSSITLDVPALDYAQKYCTRHLRAAGPQAKTLNALVETYVGLITPADCSSTGIGEHSILLEYLVAENLSVNLASMFPLGNVIKPDPSDALRILNSLCSNVSKDTLEALQSLYAGRGPVKKLLDRISLLLNIKSGAVSQLRSLLRIRPVRGKKDKDELLRIAMKNSQREIVGVLLEHFDQDSLVDRDLDSLRIATMTQNRAMVDLLLTHQRIFDVPAALREAAGSSDEEICQMLLRSGAPVNSEDVHGQKPIHIASATGHKSLVKLLVDWKAQHTALDKTNRTPLYCAAEFGHTDVVAYLLSVSDSAEKYDIKQRTPFFITCARGWLPTARLLWRSGANPLHRDKMRRTALHEAALNGYEEVVELLLCAGCRAKSRDKSKRTPLHEASSQGWDSIVNQLLSSGADVSSKDDGGETALHAACRSKNASELVVRSLLDHGADPKTPSLDGNTPLHLAATYSNATVLTMLLDKGADPQLTNQAGETPLDCAQKPESLNMASNSRTIQSRLQLTESGVSVPSSQTQGSLTENSDRKRKHLSQVDLQGQQADPMWMRDNDISVSTPPELALSRASTADDQASDVKHRVWKPGSKRKKRQRGVVEEPTLARETKNDLEGD